MNVIATAGVVSLIAACAGETESDSGGEGPVSEVSVLYHYETEPSSTAFGNALDKCSAELELNIDVQTVPSKDIISRVLQLSSTNSLPDVLVVDNPDLQSVAENGILTPLTEQNLSGDGYIQGFVDAGTYEGDLYGLGPNANTLALFYNPDMFEEADLDAPTTWDELREAAERLTSGDQYGISFAADATFETPFQWLPFLWSNGGDETELSSPQAIEALQLWTDLVESGYASEGVLNWSQADAKDQFVAGKAAMMVGGSWHVPTLREDDVSFEVVQIPIGPEGSDSISVLGGELWTLPQTGNDARQAAGAKVIECINSDERQLELAEARNTVPTNLQLVEAYESDDPSMDVFAKAVATARSRTGSLGADWPDKAEQIYQAVQLAITGKASASDALTSAAN